MAKRKRKEKSGGSSSAEAEGLRLLNDALQRHTAGDIKGAIRSYRKGLARAPKHGEAWHHYAGLLYQSGEVNDALQALNEAARLLPTNAEILSDLGGLYLSLERFSEAEQSFRASLEHAPDGVGALYNLSIALFAQGSTKASIRYLEKALTIQPNFAEAQHNLGVALRSQGNHRQALIALEKARVLQPSNPDIALETARTYREAKILPEAIRAFRDAQKYRFEPTVCIELGEVLHDNGDTADAIRVLHDGLEHTPGDEQMLVSLGRLQHNSGSLRDAEKTFEDAIATKSDSVGAIIGLSRIRKITSADDPILARMTNLLNNGSLDAEPKAALHFALGKLLDDLSDFDLAFHHVNEANRIKQKQFPYDPPRAAALCSRIMETFDRDCFTQLSLHGSDSRVPILIVGMPRSGTTLIEQLVSSHPEAAGAGELIFFPSLAAQLPKLFDVAADFPECVRSLDTGTIGEIARNYLELLRRHSRDALRITDKLPGNYLYIGLFKCLFPSGVIINCCREPLDIALSIYFQNFAGGNDFAWDLDGIGEQYVLYHDMMTHWRRIFAEDILDVRYEQTVADFENVAKNVIKHCGLGWDTACLTFHQTQREVKTASNWQVRQPLYASSVGRWKHYERHLEGLATRLDPYLQSYREAADSLS